MKNKEKSTQKTLNGNLVHDKRFDKKQVRIFGVMGYGNNNSVKIELDKETRTRFYGREIGISFINEDETPRIYPRQYVLKNKIIIIKNNVSGWSEIGEE